MSTHLTDTLDLVLERLLAGEPLPDILADQPAQANGLEPLLYTATLLQTLAPVEMPAISDRQVDRQQFLVEVARFRSQSISPGPLVRLKEWIVHTLPEQLSLPVYQWKEQRRMSILLIKVTLIFGLIFGSVGSTAVLAASSLPDSPLYPLKLAIEQTRLTLASQPADQADLHLSLARVRTQEMAQLALAGKVPDQATLTRLQQHLNQSLNLAAQMPDGPMLGLLTQAQQMIQSQQQQLVQTQAQVSQPARVALGQATELLDQANQDIEVGLQNPQTFRWRHTHTQPDPLEAPSPPTLVPEPGSNQPGGSPDCPTGDCRPVGDEHPYGRAGDTLPPGVGRSRGNPQPPCDGGDCRPAGDEHHYGRAGDTLPPNYHAGPGQPGGPCDGDDCQSVGDEPHHGTRPEQLSGGSGGSSGTLIGPGGGYSGGGGNGHNSGGGGSSHDSGGDNCCHNDHSRGGHHSGHGRW
jgi:uncharacterized membrane protein YgcG